MGWRPSKSHLSVTPARLPVYLWASPPPCPLLLAGLGPTSTPSSCTWFPPSSFLLTEGARVRGEKKKIWIPNWNQPSIPPRLLIDVWHFDVILLAKLTLEQSPCLPARIADIWLGIMCKKWSFVFRLSISSRPQNKRVSAQNDAVCPKHLDCFAVFSKACCLTREPQARLSYNSVPVITRW